MHETNTNQADSSTKELSEVERLRSRFFRDCGLAQRRDSLFYLCPRPFFTKRFPRNGEQRNGGGCAEGWCLINRLEL